MDSYCYKYTVYFNFRLRIILIMVNQNFFYHILALDFFYLTIPQNFNVFHRHELLLETVCCAK